MHRSRSLERLNEEEDLSGLFNDDWNLAGPKELGFQEDDPHLLWYMVAACDNSETLYISHCVNDKKSETISINNIQNIPPEMVLWNRFSFPEGIL